MEQRSSSVFSHSCFASSENVSSDVNTGAPKGSDTRVPVCTFFELE